MSPLDLARRALHPPWRDPGFWVLQLAVIGLVAGHFAVDVTSNADSAVPAGIPVALLLVPVSYAALRYGVVGSVATTVWAALLWLPDLLLPSDRGHVGNDLIELGLVFAVAVFVGTHIDHENAERARARRFASLLLGAQEKEQRRIAQELHDEPLQLLVHLSRSLDQAGLEESRQEVLDISSRIRAVVAGLRPPALDRLGLVPALRGLTASGGPGPQVDLEVSGDGGRLPPDVELAVFRIAQEAVNNAVSHGRPRRVSVAFEQSGGHVRLRVTDDGQGFDPHGADRRADSFGLTGMHERAELLGGRLQLTSAPGAGTVVAFAFDPPGHRGRKAAMALSMRSGRGGQPATSASTGR